MIVCLMKGTILVTWIWMRNQGVVLLKCTLHQVLLIAVKEMGVKSIQKL